MIDVTFDSSVKLVSVLFVSFFVLTVSFVLSFDEQSCVLKSTWHDSEKQPHSCPIPNIFFVPIASRCTWLPSPPNPHPFDYHPQAIPTKPSSVPSQPPFPSFHAFYNERHSTRVASSQRLEMSECTHCRSQNSFPGKEKYPWQVSLSFISTSSALY